MRTPPPADAHGTPLWVKPWLTIPEAAKLLRKSRDWVEARMADQSFVSVPDGKRTKIATSSIRRWVDGETLQSRADAGLLQASQV